MRAHLLPLLLLTAFPAAAELASAPDYLPEEEQFLPPLEPALSPAEPYDEQVITGYAGEPPIYVVVARMTGDPAAHPDLLAIQGTPCGTNWIGRDGSYLIQVYAADGTNTTAFRTTHGFDAYSTVCA